MIEFFTYPNCNTSRKAKRWLESRGIPHEVRHIVEETPSFEEIKRLWRLSEQPLKKLFNTSGKRYRDLRLKDRITNMDTDTQIRLLSENGMLLKRPILVDNETVIIGFSETKYAMHFK